MTNIVINLFIASNLLLQCHAGLPTKIRLAATEWCPYSCSSPLTPGIVTEYLSYILSPYDIELEVQILPWSRAIHDANKGIVSGLLTAVPSEAPELKFTSEPTMSYSVCFFSLANSQWRFTNPSSLKGRSLGVARDYSYGEEVDPYIQANKDSSLIYSLSGDYKISRYISMMENKRLDSFIADKYVTQWEVSQQEIKQPAISSSGCLPSHPFYLAINPQLTWAEEFIQLINRQVKDVKNKKVLKVIVNKYTQSQ
jgi:polar amino acid transport system substrate-binding protein